MSLKVRSIWIKSLLRDKREICGIPFFFLSLKGLSTYKDIPRAPRVPILGSLPYFVKSGGQTYLHQYVDKYHKTLGPVFVDNLGTGDIVFISDPESNVKVFNNEGRFPEHFILDIWKLFLEETGRKRGLFFMEGEEWYNTRVAINKHMLKPRSMVNRVQCTTEICKDLMENWKINPPRNLEYQLYCWNVECTSAIIFGKRLGYLDRLKLKNPTDHEDEFVSAIYNIFLQSAKLYLWPAKLARRFNIKSWKKFYNAVQTSLDCGDKHVREAIRECREASSEEVKESIIYKIVGEGNLSDETISRVVIDLLIASTDTTSHAAYWILYLLGKHPEVAEKARKQTLQILEEEQTFTLDTLAKMTYINAIIREAQRLYPIAPFLTRKLITDLDIFGYTVPAGTMVITSVYSMGRDPNNFTDPDVFRPERWFRNEETSENNEVNLMRKAYIPFGLGMRMCVGKRVAQLELSTLIIEALKTFSWTAEEDVESVLRMVTVPSKEIKLNLKTL